MYILKTLRIILANQLQDLIFLPEQESFREELFNQLYQLFSITDKKQKI